MRRTELDRYLREYLRLDAFDDDALNGLQVEGGDEVRKAAFAVSACQEAFERAAGAEADALVVHHGLLWKGRGAEPVVGALAARLRALLVPQLSLFAYHLPLDAHAEFGNNAVAARALGLEALAPFGDYHGMKLGWKGAFPGPRARSEVVAALEGYYGHRAMLVPGGPEAVRTVGLVSGGAAKEAVQAAREGLDLYVTGESAEPVTYLCRELGLNFAALGHYATERAGVKALAGHVAGALGIETLFVELENEA